MSKSVFRATIAVLGLLCGSAAPAAQGQKFKVLHSFRGNSDGANPYASVVVDESGNIYGTTAFGGLGFSGTVFKIDAQGKESVLHSFAASSFADGQEPFGALVRDKAGNLYGTTSTGGNPDNEGTVFKIGRGGKFTILYSFTMAGGDIHNPYAGLVVDRAGNLYGTGVSGGATAQGGVFRLNKNGKENALYSFAAAPSDGSMSYADLVRDHSGNLYGTTIAGGATNVGTVFKLDSHGQETVLYSFLGGTAGENPSAGLIRDEVGNFYGTTYGTTGFYGPFYYGTIFKIDPSGVETVLHVFTGGADGGNPSSRLVRDEAGNLYGTTGGGGAANHGTVFKLNTTGRLTVLHSFSGGRDGASPLAGLAIDEEGNLYGTAVGGGAFSMGTVFKITSQ